MSMSHVTNLLHLTLYYVTIRPKIPHIAISILGVWGHDRELNPHFFKLKWYNGDPQPRAQTCPLSLPKEQGWAGFVNYYRLYYNPHPPKKRKHEKKTHLHLPVLVLIDDDPRLPYPPPHPPTTPQFPKTSTH